MNLLLIKVHLRLCIVQYREVVFSFLEMSTAKLEQQPSIHLNKQVIDDMVLFDTNQLLLVVPEQRKVILVQSGSGKVLAELVLQANPEFICKIDANVAATTFLNNTIQFIQVNQNKLKVDSTTKVNVNVYGIASYNKNLVVSYYPPGVKIISKDGRTIHNIDNTTAGREVFKNPRWIAATSDGSIYVTDWGTYTITRLDSRLTIIQTFSGSMLTGPRGIISLNKDQLLVCSLDKSSVVLLRPSTSSMTVLLDKQPGIKHPRYICFCKEQKELYMAPQQADKILVYKLSNLN